MYISTAFKKQRQPYYLGWSFQSLSRLNHVKPTGSCKTAVQPMIQIEPALTSQFPCQFKVNLLTVFCLWDLSRVSPIPPKERVLQEEINFSSVLYTAEFNTSYTLTH